MIAILALAAVHQDAVASLRVPLSNGAETAVQVREDSQSGYAFSVDCLTKCARPLHFKTAIGDAPLGLIDLQAHGLVYSVWGTGCCYIVRVWRLSPTGVSLLLETGSRSQPSLLRKSDLAVETYMRATDSRGREIGTALRPVRWTYRQGRFVRS